MVCSQLIKLSSTVVPSSGVLFQELDGEIVLLHVERECYFGLNEVGARLWNGLLAKQTIDSICANMLADFDVDRATLEADVRELVSALVEAGLASVE